MGVTIHYTLRFSGNEDEYEAFAAELMCDLRARKDFHDAKIEMTEHICAFHKELSEDIARSSFRIYGPENEPEEIECTSDCVWDFPVFNKALCVSFPGTETLVVAPGRYFCKTQFGDDFSRQHPALIFILDYCRDHGWSVEVVDETGYWDHRDLKKMMEPQNLISRMSDKLIEKFENMPAEDLQYDREEAEKNRQKRERNLKAILSEHGLGDVEEGGEESAIEELSKTDPELAGRLRRIRQAGIDQDWEFLDKLCDDITRAANDAWNEIGNAAPGPDEKRDQEHDKAEG
jgi:hypothetical protein